MRRGGAQACRSEALGIRSQGIASATGRVSRTVWRPAGRARTSLSTRRSMRRRPRCGGSSAHRSVAYSMRTRFSRGGSVPAAGAVRIPYPPLRCAKSVRVPAAPGMRRRGPALRRAGPPDFPGGPRIRRRKVGIACSQEAAEALPALTRPVDPRDGRFRAFRFVLRAAPIPLRTAAPIPIGVWRHRAPRAR